jgi:hypothetical protein
METPSLARVFRAPSELGHRSVLEIALINLAALMLPAEKIHRRDDEMENRSGGRREEIYRCWEILLLFAAPIALQIPFEKPPLLVIGCYSWNCSGNK